MARNMAQVLYLSIDFFIDFFIEFFIDFKGFSRQKNTFMMGNGKTI